MPVRYVDIWKSYKRITRKIYKQVENSMIRGTATVVEPITRTEAKRLTNRTRARNKAIFKRLYG